MSASLQKQRAALQRVKGALSKEDEALGRKEKALSAMNQRFRRLETLKEKRLRKEKAGVDMAERALKDASLSLFSLYLFRFVDLSAEGALFILDLSHSFIRSFIHSSKRAAPSRRSSGTSLGESLGSSSR